MVNNVTLLHVVFFVARYIAINSLETILHAIMSSVDASITSKSNKKENASCESSYGSLVFDAKPDEALNVVDLQLKHSSNESSVEEGKNKIETSVCVHRSNKSVNNIEKDEIKQPFPKETSLSAGGKTLFERICCGNIRRCVEEEIDPSSKEACVGEEKKQVSDSLYFVNKCDESFVNEELQIRLSNDETCIRGGTKPSFKTSFCDNIPNDSANNVETLIIGGKKRTLESSVCDEISDDSFSNGEEFHNGTTFEGNKKAIFECFSCEKQFPYASGLKAHLRIHTGEKPFSCELCDKTFSAKSAMNLHIRLIHNQEQPHVCDVCEKVFSFKSHLANHMMVHSGERPYVCEVCDKTFTRNRGLTRHLRVHSGERPYVCDVCDQTFSQSSHLTVHMRVHTGERPYVCRVCDKSFTNNSNLNSHSRVHMNVYRVNHRPYMCPECGKGFIRDSHLTDHLRVHTGERPYACEVCDKRFTQSSSLKSHSRLHTGEKPYACAVCHQAFTHKLYLTNHLRSHADPPPSISPTFVQSYPFDSSYSSFGPFVKPFSSSSQIDQDS